jgi:hypothetical protein
MENKPCDLEFTTELLFLKNGSLCAKTDLLNLQGNLEYERGLFPGLTLYWNKDWVKCLLDDKNCTEA